MMYATQFFAALAALTSVNAAVLPRQVVTPIPSHGAPAGTYHITDFYVYQGIESIITNYNLNVTDLANPSTPPSNISTICHTSPSTTPAIAGFTDLTCDDPSVKWSFLVNSTGYYLEIKHNWGQQVQHAIVTAYDNVTDSASAFFPASDLFYNPNAPAGFPAPSIDAPSTFDLEFYRYIQ